MPRIRVRIRVRIGVRIGVRERVRVRATLDEICDESIYNRCVTASLVGVDSDACAGLANAFGNRDMIAILINCVKHDD